MMMSADHLRTNRQGKYRAICVWNEEGRYLQYIIITDQTIADLKI